MQSYLHTLSPFAIRFSEDIGIRWYGLSYLAGFYVGYLIIRWFVRRYNGPLPESLASDFVFAVAVGTIIGGRLGYCLFYAPHLLTDFSSTAPFWGVLAVNQGGMASHGGIVGIILACVWYARRHKLPILHCMDLSTFGGAIGIFFGRIANFVNGELVGRAAPPGTEWTVKFPQDMLSWNGYEHERLQSLAQIAPQFGVSADQWQVLIAQGNSEPARSTIDTVVHRILAALQSGNSTLADQIAPLLTARYPSQLYQAILEGGVVALVLLLVALQRRAHGTFAAIFLILYSLMRILGEQYRMPDLQIGFQLFGLTRGQWLSFGTAAFGLICLWFVTRTSSNARR